jgi:predicted SAM-dependent methyltransferase
MQNIGSFTVMHQSTPECRVLNLDLLDCSKFAKALDYEFRQYNAVDPMVFADESSMNAIMTSHMFEHLTREESMRFLKQCLVLLKPGGVIIPIAVPDAYMLADQCPPSQRGQKS